jgi:signal transduction histidine kinase/HAMP domain-containing protein
MSRSIVSLRRLRASIGAKIFGAFAAMSLITGLIGAYGIYELFTAAHIVVDTYDGSLMAINYARSANATFTQIDRDELRRQRAAPERRADIESEIEQLLVGIAGDLDVASDRARTAEARQTAQDIKSEIATWDAKRRAYVGMSFNSDIEETSSSILERFDHLTELIADHGFIERRQAVWSISYLEYTAVGALAGALAIGGVISYLLRRRIVRPLTAAAGIADRISRGELRTHVPEGGTDETGILLRSMRLMRDNIAAMMEHEAAQRQSAQTRLVDALESSQEGMALIGPDRQIIITNSQFLRFFPSLLDEVKEGADFAIAFATVYPQWLEMIATGGELQLEDGRWLRCSRNPTQDGGFFLFFSDFTEIKQREENFKEAKQQAETANKAKSTFLTNMSHELRTPLNAIIGFSEVMKGAYFGPLGNARYDEYAGSILDSGHHLLAIINSVLELAKSDAGKMTLNLDLVDLADVLTDCATSIGPQCEKQELMLKTDWPAEDFIIEGDATKLRQIILNLLSNAVKFTKPGGRVWLLARHRPQDRIEIQVVDTGIGMAPEDVPIALAPFGQVDSGLTRQYEGTGLGLPLSKAFVELHHGSLNIQTTTGKGTTITVSLPRRIASEIGVDKAAAA